MAHHGGRVGGWLAGVLAGAALAASPPAAAQDIPGCYDVTVGEWSLEAPASTDRDTIPDWSGFGPDSLYYALPPRIRLHDEVAADWPRGNRMTVPEDALQVPHRGLRWWSGQDSLVLLQTTGFVGVVSTLRPDATGWAGTARTFTDVAGQVWFEAPVSLRPVSCDSPPPIPASAQRPLLRRVEIAGGRAVILGQPLPGGVPTEPRRSGASTLLADVRGILAGADTLIAQVTADGLVRGVEARYPDGYDTASLVEVLTSRMGPGRRIEISEGWHWANRTTEIYLWVDPNRLRVRMSDPRCR